MRFRLFQPALLLAAAAFFGCASAEIVSKKAKTFDRKISKMLVVTEGALDYGPFYATLEQALAHEFGLRKMEVRVKRLDPVSLDPEADVAGWLAEIKPEAVLRVSPKGIREVNNSPGNVGVGIGTVTLASGGGKETVSRVFDLKMFLPTETVPVWRAELSTKGGSKGKAAARPAAREIANQLEQDRIIR